jgi:hypothetical protein
MGRRSSKKSEAKPAGTPSVLPMQLQIGDRFADETGEWEIVSGPATMLGGKTVRACVQKVSEPAVTEERIWSAYEKVAVRRLDEEGKR